MKYLNLFVKGYISFYKLVSIVVLGGIAIFAMSQVSGLSVVMCVALGWFIHKKYEVKQRGKRKKAKKPNKAKKSDLTK